MLKEALIEPVKLDKNRKPISQGKPYHVDADAVVLSLGARSVNALAKELEGKFELFVIGDAKKVGRIADATREAYDVAIHKLK